jgi:branched-chain amino acid transport system ATP-binding protein
LDLLRIDTLTVWYESMFGDVRALNRCSLSVRPGRITCLLGVNGAGKSTLFKTISGVVGDDDGKITAGRIYWKNMDITGASPPRAVSLGIAHAPQGRHIFHTLPVEDNLLLGAFLQRRRPDARRSIDNSRRMVFDLFPVLARRRRQKAGTLSGGEQQMLAVGRALMAAPELVLLDEPFLGIAPQVIEEISRALGRLKAQGTTILLAEHNARAALAASDHGYLMDDGYALEGAPAAELLDDRRIRSFYLGEKR